MKAVEVRVRRLAGFTDSMIGTDLTTKAFKGAAVRVAERVAAGAPPAVRPLPAPGPRQALARAQLALPAPGHQLALVTAPAQAGAAHLCGVAWSLLSARPHRPPQPGSSQAQRYAHDRPQSWCAHGLPPVPGAPLAAWQPGPCDDTGHALIFSGEQAGPGAAAAVAVLAGPERTAGRQSPACPLLKRRSAVIVAAPCSPAVVLPAYGGGAILRAACPGLSAVRDLDLLASEHSRAGERRATRRTCASCGVFRPLPVSDPCHYRGTWGRWLADKPSRGR